jgi:pSer/pThr/pTyr-binding forkhead associated (FHA) protein
MSGFDSSNAARNVCLSLLYRGASIALHPAKVVLIGRDPSCDIVLDDRFVSRQHARVGVTRPTDGSSLGVVTLEDLQSANGVYVDGERVEQSRPIEPGQRITIGSHELLLVTAALASRSSRTTRPERAPGSSRSDADPSPDSGVHTLPPERSFTPTSGPALWSAETDPGSFADVLDAVFGKLLANGRVDEAEHMMRRHLEATLRQCRDESRRDRALAERCSEIALRLAAATRRSEWLSYVLELHLALDQLPSAEHIDRLYELFHELTDFPLPLLRRYLSAVETHASGFGPAERFLLQRLQGLVRMAAAR